MFYIVNNCFCCYGIESDDLWYCIMIIYFCYVINYLIMFIYIEIDVEVGYGDLFWI